jgi:hypothetical protein
MFILVQDRFRLYFWVIFWWYTYLNINHSASCLDGIIRIVYNLQSLIPLLHVRSYNHLFHSYTFTLADFSTINYCLKLSHTLHLHTLKLSPRSCSANLLLKTAPYKLISRTAPYKLPSSQSLRELN